MPRGFARSLIVGLTLLAPGAVGAKELLVFAAASLTEALEEIGARWMAESGETVAFSFAGSTPISADGGQ